MAPRRSVSAVEARFRAAVLTMSTSKAAGATSFAGGTSAAERAGEAKGEREARLDGDESGARLVELARRVGADLAGRELIPDDRGRIEEQLRRWADVERCDLILTTGGTGFSPTDVTPEATRAVIEREAPGLAEAMRLASREHTRHWMLSRALAGIRGSTLIVNFPGNPKAIDETADAIAEALPHALALLRGRPVDHR